MFSFRRKSIRIISTYFLSFQQPSCSFKISYCVSVMSTKAVIQFYLKQKEEEFGIENELTTFIYTFFPHTQYNLFINVNHNIHSQWLSKYKAENAIISKFFLQLNLYHRQEVRHRAQRSKQKSFQFNVNLFLSE